MYCQTNEWQRALVLALIVLATANASWSRCLIPPADSLLSDDAIILTLRVQEGIRLDTTLALQLDQALAAARATSDSIKNLHARPDYVPTDILLKSAAPWTNAWRTGMLQTGYPRIDSLSGLYNLLAVKPLLLDNWFVLKFRYPNHMPRLAEFYAKIPGVEFAEQNGILGDGDNIEHLRKSGQWHFVFSHGWGDCLAGCIYRKYFYVNVSKGLEAAYLGSVGPEFDTPQIYLWNIPSWFDATVFANVEAILETAQTASDWWAQRHAVEVIGLLFIHDSPLGADNYNRSLFDALRTGIRQRRDEVLSFLQLLQGQPNLDADVLRAVAVAQQRVLSFYAGDLARYFPMTVGNYWQLSGSPKEEIIDSMQVEGKPYHHFDQLREYSNVHARMSADKQMLIRTAFGESVWLDFAMPMHQYWTVPAFDDSSTLIWSVHLSSRTDTVTVPAGTFTHCFRFFFNTLWTRDAWIEWYAPEVGLVKRIFRPYDFSLPSEEYLLTQAFVDGQHYPSTTTVREPKSLARFFALAPSYPNPLVSDINNVQTEIRYQLAADTEVTIKIYDLLGREVKTLVQGPAPAGEHFIQWNGADAQGSPVPTGIYFYRLEAGAFAQTRKLIIVR